MADLKPGTLKCKKAWDRLKKKHEQTNESNFFADERGLLEGHEENERQL